MTCHHNPDLPDCPCIDAAEDVRDNPPNDFRDDWIDNQFERAMYPRQWD